MTRPDPRSGRRQNLRKRRDLPSGRITFLFTDVEGSTKLLHELGAAEYAAALAAHRRILRQAFAEHGGAEVDTQGDAFFVAFASARAGLDAAAAAQERLRGGRLRVRMGIHTGTPHVTDEGYVGIDVHRAARIAACGHGGQVLVSADTAALVGATGLRDLGLHRLKDLSAPEHIYQLGDSAFPPLTSLHQTNLPIPTTPFLGRRTELAEVLELLSRSEVRMLTLTGAGGTGKTRLAIQAAAESAERYPHGMWWVPLAALRDPRLVLDAAAQALGAKAGLAEHVADKALLLVLDNFEHLIESGPDVVALLTRCPNLEILVTSRQPLHVRGEQEYAVPPLERDTSVALFLDRARAIRPDLKPDASIPEICRRLDDLPLAVELAAARVRALAPAQILDRLRRALPLLTGGPRDLPERQRTLRSTIEWSYELLVPAERRLFGRLAIFRGGCELDAAERVTDAELDTLQSLVDKSLVRHRDTRYTMLETIREFAVELLEASGEAAAMAERHHRYFLALAEETNPHIWKGAPYAWLHRLEVEHDNIRAALDGFEAAGDTELVLRLAGSLWSFWNLRGHVREGIRRVERALVADVRPTAARAKALTGAAAMAVHAGDAKTARARAEEALSLHRSLGDAEGATLARSYLATAAAAERDWATARQIAQENIEDYRALGDENTAILATTLLAWVCRELGERVRSRALSEENVRRARALGNRRVEAMSLDRLGMLTIDEGRIEDGVALFMQSHRISRDVGDEVSATLSVARLARAALAAGRVTTAAKLGAKAQLLVEEIGLTLKSWSVMEAGLVETLAETHKQLDPAAFAEACEQGRSLSIDEALALV